MVGAAGALRETIKSHARLQRQRAGEEALDRPEEPRRGAQHPRDGEVLHAHKDRAHGRTAGHVPRGDRGVAVSDGGREERAGQDGQARRRGALPTVEGPERCAQ